MKPKTIPKLKRRANREERRAKYRAALVAHMMEGHSKHTFPPFNHNWQQRYTELTKDIS